MITVRSLLDDAWYDRYQKSPNLCTLPVSPSLALQTEAKR